jgi:ribosomal protein L7/L12
MNWYWIAGLVAVVVLALVSRRGEGSGSARSRPGAGPPSPERIDELIRARQKIEAIKQYRMLHQVDLKAAKEAVEARARELGL